MMVKRATTANNMALAYQRQNGHVHGVAISERKGGITYTRHRAITEHNSTSKRRFWLMVDLTLFSKNTVDLGYRLVDKICFFSQRI
jgi:hypothetical protein